MPRKSFTLRGEFKPQGRKATILGSKVHTTYKGGGFLVTYESKSAGLRNPERIYVTVEIEDHGSKTWMTTGLAPSPEVAKIHAGSAFRTHFKRKTGEPQDVEDVRRLGCQCEMI